MKYFIPSWYQSSRWWASTPVPYYQESKQTDFDDMHSLMKMHYNNQSQFQIIVLNYAPHLRTYLHRHDLYEASYWSLFDAIQGFTDQTMHLCHFKDLSWPDETEFMYTPYMVRAITSESTYTHIHFSQDGYITWFEEFESQRKVRRFVMDDRGFISSIIDYDDKGDEKEQHYLTVDGDVILTENCIDHSVVVSEKYTDDFNQSQYAHMTEMIDEKFAEYDASKMNPSAPVIVVADERHNHLITRHLPFKRICFSVFQNRNPIPTTTMLSSMKLGKYWLVDRSSTEQRLRQYHTDNHLSNELMKITPFDAQSSPNKSSQLSETYIGLWLDSLDDQQLQSVMAIIVPFIKKDVKYRLQLLTRCEKQALPTWLLALMDHENEQFNRTAVDQQGVAPLLESEQEQIKKVDIVHVPFEKDMVEALLNMRVIVDLGAEPDLYLQISSIGSGIPQINQMHSEYVEDQENGMIIDHFHELEGALDYFLTHLKNWNFAYATSLKLIDKYTYRNIVKQLDELIVGDHHAASI
ncbi:accessory Sec system protein Asp1 [Staphylococcus delphini]|uniref:Accessory Sec system protein Asp1 n=1 Tax=Staphylococcus delphini TaxID=53344 RepID=A0A2A4GUS9_9STAP|nr:accessory Sec system protein Asp1 [Staphylococcus delphini]PCF54396.1 accessory Sec system protein Asp1 [Staphylococcus delphini]PCF63103.1 accessory Sec system protein Asp1 [Staphylococcus delphini]